MIADEYVPSETTVRLAYLREKTVGTAHDMEQARAEFDRFLARVKRDAWEEGAQYGALSPGYYPDENPYGYEEAE